MGDLTLCIGLWSGRLLFDTNFPFPLIIPFLLLSVLIMSACSLLFFNLVFNGMKKIWLLYTIYTSITQINFFIDVPILSRQHISKLKRIILHKDVLHFDSQRYQSEFFISYKNGFNCIFLLVFSLIHISWIIILVACNSEVNNIYVHIHNIFLNIHLDNYMNYCSMFHRSNTYYYIYLSK